MSGRPTKFKSEYSEQVLKLCRLGATDKEIANFFNVSESTLNLWKKEHPAFSESIKNGKTVADMEVADKLYKRATGYTHKEDKIFQYEGSPVVVPTLKHYPPDPISIIYWLNNRQPNNWKNKQEIKHIGKLGVDADEVFE
jgi:hypothetical protein